MNEQDKKQDHENDDVKEFTERDEVPKYVDQDLSKSKNENCAFDCEKVKAVDYEKESAPEEATEIEKDISVSEETSLEASGEPQFSCSYEPPYGAPIFSSEISAQTEEKSSKKKAKKWIAILLIGAILLSFAGGALLWNALFRKQSSLQLPSGAGTKADEKKVYSSFAEVVEAVADSVVDVDVVLSNGQVFGSGVIIDAQGYVVTNEHVVEKALQIIVRLRNGIEYEAQYIGGNSKYDIAVLKISPVSKDTLTVATIGKSSDVKVCEDVIAIGNPLGLLSGTVTKGAISSAYRKIRTDFYPMIFLQIDAPISQGNSGGGLFNISGELIGIVNAKVINADAGAEGLGFAIPIDVAWRCAQDLIQYGYVTGEPDLGISIAVKTNGNIVVSESRNELLAENDQIIEINGVSVTSIEDIYFVTDKMKIGDIVQFKVLRKSGFSSYTQHEVSITVQEYKP